MKYWEVIADKLSATVGLGAIAVLLLSMVGAGWLMLTRAMANATSSNLMNF
jgi:hypothetical protein